ncbi:putative mixed polyketide synthase/non-ribosomal peptide synthetase [Streptococcus troglodytae]|uniref:Putative mixed polyketide synthase/non-ribosomal peptide synthetase n=1 Tax=Streptococcus troglodytae TaxID=1111760 RepID=A0A1L7LJI1_9STRE|nr:putative mixed polyketide synthase/non-ribosomal peptide synthetase [Streptococcus troglodytae]
MNSVKESGIEQEIENGVVALYKIFKGSLLKLDKAKIRIMSVTKDCYAIVEQDKGINYAYGALNGFSRSLMKEMNRYCMKIIDLDETSMEQKYIISLLKTEMSNNQKLLIGYRNGSRFVQKVQSKEIKSECEKTVFEDNKQYIIVGGMGGIGRKIISKITKNTNSHIIVIGRKKREELNDIADCLIRESKIEYYSCNISDYSSIKNCIDEIKQEYGSIHGIIHAAGIVEDQYLINKQLDSFKKVLSPKILGAYYLNELTKDEALDFFIVFSSIVSIVGNSGQADYAAANSF